MLSAASWRDLSAQNEALDPGEGWTDAGVADGPLGRAAWRILDAQYFGLAQRRERVFVVAGFGDGAHPAEILFEWESLRRDFAPGREAGQGAAGTLSAHASAGGGLGTDFECAGGVIPIVEAAVAFGGNNTSGCIDIATACNGKGGSGRSDFESETFVVEQNNVSSMPPLPSMRAHETPNYAVAHTLRAEHDGSEDGTGRGVPLVPWMPETEDPISAHEQRTYSHEGGHNFRLRNVVPNGSMAVRRLLPVECERLQGFPDGYTLIPYRGKPAADGPRYKALGNSFAVPVIRWIGQRIQEKA